MADEISSDPFENLIRDVASSSQSPADSGGQNPASNAANPGQGVGAPTTPQAEGGANPGAQDQSTANPAQKAPDQGMNPGEENPTVPPAQPGEDGKGSVPESLKPFEATLKSKQWDVSKPEGVAKVLQSYQEAETTLGRRTTEANLLLSRQQDIEKDFQSGPEGVNRRLEAMGLSKLDVPTPETRLGEYKAIYQNLSIALSEGATPEQRNAAIEKLNGLVYEPMDNLRIRIAAGAGKGEDAKVQLQSFRNNAANLFNQRVAADPTLHAAYDAILPAFQAGGVFHSFGLNEFSMTSSPERAQAIESIGRAVTFHQSAFNQDGSVKEGGPIDVEIKKALALQDRNANAAPAGNRQPPAPNSNGNQNQDPIGAMLNSWALESATA